METIFVVDDSAPERSTLEKMLRLDGHRVRSFATGEDAMRAIEAEVPNLVLLDVVMSGLDGFALCRQLKERPATREIPVIFLSGLNDAESKVQGFEAGAVDYITKPFSVMEIRARVRTHLALREARGRLAQQNAGLEEAARLQANVERILRHDLRVSLAAVIGFSELISEELHPAHSSAAHARIITSSAYAMLSMVHASFDLLKMERGAYVLQAAAFDLAAVVRQVMGEHSLAAAEREVRIRMEFDDECADDALAKGEALLTHSLFNNLLRNALEASPPRTVISLRFCMGEEVTTTTLRNAGEVPPDIRARFFERDATAGKVGGSGLGTYSARLMAETQGGSIRLDTSEPGHTTLVVTLPAPSRGETAKFRAARDRHSLWARPPAESASARILVVTEDDANRAYLKRVLQGFAARLDTATDGRQALAALQQVSYDAAILDLEMPGFNGLEVVRAFRAWQSLRPSHEPGPVVLGLTGHLSTATRNACALAGFHRVLIRPVSRRRLQEELLNALFPARQVVQLDAAISDLIPAFLASQEKQLRECVELLQRRDGPGLRVLAQRLSSNFSMYGFGRAGALASDAAEAAGSGKLESAADVLAALGAHLREVEICYG